MRMPSVAAACTLWVAVVGPAFFLEGATIVIPSIPDLEVQGGETVLIPAAESAIVHHFDDGSIVVHGTSKGSGRMLLKSVRCGREADLDNRSNARH